MTPTPRGGQAEVVLHVLPAVTLGPSADEPADPTGYGRAEVAMNHLPVVTAEWLPQFVLTLHVRPGADPAQAGIDLLDLLAALDDKERELGGRGLVWDRGGNGVQPGGVMRVTLRAVEPVGADERLARLAAALPTGPSFDRCEARVAV